MIYNKPFGWMGWGMAILLAAILNLSLFGLMPGLIQQPKMPEDMEPILDMVQVIRLKTPENSPKKEQKKEPKPKKLEQKRPEPQKREMTSPQPPLQVKPKLPFELNPSLPKLSTSLAMPPLEHFSMDVDAPEIEPSPTPLPKATAPVISAPAPMKSFYAVGELDGGIVPLVKVPPLYPMRARRRGIEGWVTVRFQVDKTGRVTQPEIVKADPEKVFDNSVLRCVSQWKFRPGTVEGTPVNTLVETTIRFDLE